VSSDGTRRWSYPKHCIRGNCLWKIAVVEDLVGGEWIEKIRLIALDLLAKGSRPDEGWGYKDMDETMGPYYYSCPISYLDMVPCPDSENARKWRAEVRAKNQGKADTTAVLRRMKVGDRLYLKKGCQPESVILTSKRPLQGTVGHMTYKIPRKLVDPIKTQFFLT
jgi:hypothetical protein